MLKFKLRKVMSICTSLMCIVSAINITAFAAEDDVKIGDIVDFTYIIREEVDGEMITRDGTDEEKIAYLTESGKTPGTEFSVGTASYIVTDDYKIQYNGEKEITDLDKLTDLKARSDSRPTMMYPNGLPYKVGTYNFNEYTFTNYKFAKGTYGGPAAAITINISPSNTHYINLSIIDSRNHEAMSNYDNLECKKRNLVTIKDWVYGDIAFYLKFSNAGSTTTCKAGFTIE